MKRYIFYLLTACMSMFAFNSCGSNTVGGGGGSVDVARQIEDAKNYLASYRDNLLDMSEVEARAALINDMAQNSRISDAGLSDDSTTVWWVTQDDINFSLPTRTRSTLTEKDQNDQDDSQGQIVASLMDHPVSELLNDPSEDRSALVLSPFQWNWSLMDSRQQEDETVFISQLLEKIGIDVTYIANVEANQANITLNQFMEWDEYDIVAFTSHAGIDRHGNIFINTGISATEAVIDQYMEALQSGKMKISLNYDKWFEESDTPMLCLTLEWFAEQYPEGIDDVLIYAGVGKGLFNEDLAYALNGTGSAFVSWDNDVSTNVAALTGREIFAQLVSSAKNIQEVISQILASGGGRFQETDAVVGYYGNGDYGLVEEAVTIATTPAGFDNIGALLAGFGYNVETISTSQLNDLSVLQTFDIVAVNCATGLSFTAEQARETIQDYISQGGKLYTSDYAYIFVKQSFPDHITFPENPTSGHAQVTTAMISDNGLKEFLGTENVSVNFNLSDWVVIENLPSQTMELVRGDVTTSLSSGKLSVEEITNREQRHAHSGDPGNTVLDAVSRPLAARFEYGDGVVVFTSFHNQAQADDQLKFTLEYFTIFD